MGAQRQKQTLVVPPPTDHSSAQFHSFYPFSLSILLCGLASLLSYFLSTDCDDEFNLTLLRHFTLNCSSHSPDLTFRFIMILKSAHNSHKEPFQKPAAWPSTKHIFPWLKLPHSTVLSLFFPLLSQLRWEKKKKSFPRFNSFRLFVKAFVYHLLLPCN